jgi:hypothetical protein
MFFATGNHVFGVMRNGETVMLRQNREEAKKWLSVRESASVQAGGR